MKRKHLSMKKLHQYAAEFLIKEHKKDEIVRCGGSVEFMDLIRKSEVGKFLDFIWKNPEI